MVFIMNPKHQQQRFGSITKDLRKSKCLNLLLHTLNLLKSLATSTINVTCLSLFHLSCSHDSVCFGNKYKTLSLPILQLREAVLKVWWYPHPEGSLRLLQGICEVKTISIITLEHYLPFSMLTLELMVQKQSWVKLLMPDCQWRQWY